MSCFTFYEWFYNIIVTKMCCWISSLFFINYLLWFQNVNLTRLLSRKEQTICVQWIKVCMYLMAITTETKKKLNILFSMNVIIALLCKYIFIVSVKNVHKNTKPQNVPWALNVRCNILFEVMYIYIWKLLYTWHCCILDVYDT